VKPELTFRRSLRLISKRWWMMVAGGLVFAVLAFLVASNKNGHYVTSTNLTLYDQTVAPAQTGPGLELTPANPKFTADWTTANFLSENAAAAASSAVGGHPSASQILTSLTVTPLSTSQVQLTYTGSGDQAKDLTVLKTYAQSFINHRVKAEQQSISDAINSYNTQPNLPGATRRELAHVANQLAAVPSGFRTGFESTPNGSVSKVGAGGPPAIVVLFGGLLAGLTAGALLALAVGRFDKFVRRPNDIEVVGVPVVDIDSETDSASVQLLRSELELAGMGTRLGVMAITRATRAEGSSGLALALARTFAGVGTPTILVSGDLRARKVRSEEGLSALLDGTSAAASLVELEPNLQWLPEGTSNALPETLFSATRVERIIRDLRERASVIVIDTPAVLQDSETLPLIACSDIVLLAVRPGMTRWNMLGSAVALIQRVAKRPLHICYDRATDVSSVPALGDRPAGVVGRVHQAIEVPAGS
jgi:hypothetical protein